LRNKTVLALSGLGRPESFEALLAELGARTLPWRFPDHHPYSVQDLGTPPSGADFIVTTAKDAVRLPPTWRSVVPLLVLEVEAEVRPAAPFWRLVDPCFRSHPSSGKP
jgi:tetraacyldisaccharide 4'-kinase